MKITIDHYHISHTITLDDGAADLNTVVPLLKGLLVGVGYHPSNVDEYFTEEEWFPKDSDRNGEADVPMMHWPADFDGPHSISANERKNLKICSDETYD